MGIPSDVNIRSAYWRKKTPIPEEMDPDRDRCGVIFCVPTVPFEGEHVRTVLGIVKDALEKYGFEPILIIGAISARVIYLNVDITSTARSSGRTRRP